MSDPKQLYNEAAKLFLEVCSPDDESRSKRLDDTCRDKPELRDRVEKLLSQDNRSALNLPCLPSSRLETASINDTKPDPLARAVAPNIPGFEIQELLGQGGMGFVWKARQTSTQRDVALKTIKTARSVSRASMMRFEREIELASRLEHDNIARVYESGEHQGVPYYAMQLIDGRTLDKFVSNNGLGHREIIELMVDVWRAFNMLIKKA